tara:strand:+ start:125 stop:640 length:516 start_codon:yes stop_codon:yes gene_type:complete
MLIPVVMAHSHGGHSGHSSHSTHTTHSSHSTHKSYNPHHVATSVIATYLIFGHFSDGVENLFYVNENYYTFNITYYVKQVDDGTKECIYYIVSENFNIESTIDASNMKIVENVSYVDDYGYDFHEFCRTLDNGNYHYRIGMLIGIILVIIVVCCCINCAIGSDNYSNRSLY